MKVIIPVAGKGTRVRPHSYSKSKSFLKIAGKTVIEYLIDHLSTLNPEEYIIITDMAYNKDYKNFLETKYPNYKFSFPIQEIPLGPGHVILQAKDLIKKGDDLFILFSDTIFVKDLSCINHLKKESDAIIFAKEVEDYQRFGVIVHNNKHITKFVEKPSTPISKLAAIGAYYVKDGKNLIKYIEKLIKLNIMINGEYFLTDAFVLMIQDNKTLFVEEVDDWFDTGKIETILATHQKILKGGIWKGDNLQIKNSIIGKNISLGNNTQIINCNIENSIIGENTILQGLTIKDSVIGDNVKIKKDGHSFNVGDDCYIQ